MTVLRNILDDLVEKKLWPIAVALVVALVALPLAFGGGGAEDPPPAAATPAAGGPAATAANAVSLEPDPAVDKRTRDGKVRNPFKQLAKAAEAATDTAASAPSTGGGASSPVVSAPGTPSAGTPSATTTKPSAPKADDDKADAPMQSLPAVKPKAGEPADERADVVFRFGERGEDARRFDDPRKLASMPSAAYPLLVFAGVRSDGKALRFMVNPLTRVTGDGRCRPSRSSCRTLEIRPGGTAVVEVLESATKVVEYRLDVVRADR